MTDQSVTQDTISRFRCQGWGDRVKEALPSARIPGGKAHSKHSHIRFGHLMRKPPSSGIIIWLTQLSGVMHVKCL